MKALTKMLLVALLVVGLSNVAMATEHEQTVTLNVDPIHVLGVSAATVGPLLIIAPATAGDVPADVVDATTIIDYTTVPTAVDGTSKISVQLDGPAPAGTQLTLTATSVPNLCGTGDAEQILLVTSLDILTAIPSCNTGIGSGATLTYSFEVTAVADLDATLDNTPKVTFTITDT